MYTIRSYKDFILWLIIFSIINGILGVSYNQPKFSSMATWNPNGSTFANNSTVGIEPYGIFINTINTIYVSNRQDRLVQVWSYGNKIPIRTISDNLTYPRSLFVTTCGDVYVDNGDQGRVDSWSLNATDSELAMNFSGICFGLFVDINNNLYCSVGFLHQVEKISLNSTVTTLAIVAGRGVSGSSSYLLDDPRGIFVDINLDLYVADSDNGRIQLFRSGDILGIAVAGKGASGTPTLVAPHGITLDSDGYLFIVDSGNNRIIGSGPSGFRCIVGCNGKGSTSNKLSFPQTMAFDSYGNIFVTDRDNDRIQKFILIQNSSEFTSTMLSTTTIMTESTAIQITDEMAVPMTELITVPMTELTTTPMTEQTTVQASETWFIPLTCSDTTRIGLTCNVSNMPCDISKPCENNGICTNTNNTSYGYECECPADFSGINCEINHHLCKPNPCWNGKCNIFNMTFNCTCTTGWEGSHCQTKVNYCEHIRCLNNGVCRPLFRNYTCECLAGSYYGLYCEITTTRIIIYQIVSKSFAYIAIIAMVSVCTFIVVMDILKYYFGIDPVYRNWRRLQPLNRIEKDAFYTNRLSINGIHLSQKSSSTKSSVTLIKATL